MKKIIFITLLIIALLGISLFSINNSSIAAFSINNADLYSKGSFDNLLKFDNYIVQCEYVVYKNGDAEYPAYCLQRELPGVKTNANYSVSVNSLLTNAKVWRAITNGYPYKSLEELGCNTQEEAYLATKQAVYCMLYDRNPDTYTAIGEAGTRTLNALKQIVNTANNTTNTKPSSNIEIKAQNNSWEVDTINPEYVSQLFETSSNTAYTVSLENNYPEGTKIVNENNIENNTFNSKEKFKIIIPIKNAIENGDFNVCILGKSATRPILYGKSANSAFQDYALTGSIYEDSTGVQKVNYTKNLTQIIIKKQNTDSKLALQGVEFELLDKSQNVIYTNLITDENGIIEIKNLVPSMYYIKEVKTLPDYNLYDKLIEANVKLNETLTITVNNEENHTETKIETTESNLEVSNPIANIEITSPATNVEVSVPVSNSNIEVTNKPKVLPKTGM